jgi:hypothetical protein
MKKILLVIALGGFMLGNLIAQTDTTANKNKPEIKFEKTEIDLGLVPTGPKPFEFVFTNTGIDPLVLSNVQPSCGCTIVEKPQEPILKGKKGVIKGTFNAASPGTFTKNITVSSNAKTAVVYLTFKVTVENPAPPAPPIAPAITK